MEKQLVLVPSVTYAMKAKSILDRHYIKSYIERTPKNHQLTSCGYCVFVPNDTKTALDILLRNNIKVIGMIERDNI